MSRWPSTQASRILCALLLRIGWQIKRSTGSHRILQRPGKRDVVFAFQDRDEIGPRMLARLAKVTGRSVRLTYLFDRVPLPADSGPIDFREYRTFAEAVYFAYAHH